METDSAAAVPAICSGEGWQSSATVTGKVSETLPPPPPPLPPSFSLTHSSPSFFVISGSGKQNPSIEVLQQNLCRQQICAVTHLRSCLFQGSVSATREPLFCKSVSGRWQVACVWSCATIQQPERPSSALLLSVSTAQERTLQPFSSIRFGCRRRTRTHQRMETSL